MKFSVSDYFMIGDKICVHLVFVAFILVYKDMTSLTILITSAENKALPPVYSFHTCAFSPTCANRLLDQPSC